MGHKAHPVGLRLGLHRKWKSNWYFDSINYTKLMHLGLNVEKFITGFLYFLKLRKTLVLKSHLIKLPSNKIFVFIFYYRFRKKWKRNYKNFWNQNIWKKKVKFFLKKQQQQQTLISTKKLFKLHSKNFIKQFNLKTYILPIKSNLIKQTLLKKSNFIFFFKQSKNYFLFFEKLKNLIVKNKKIKKKIMFNLKFFKLILKKQKSFLKNKSKFIFPFIKQYLFKQFFFNFFIFNKLISKINLKKMYYLINFLKKKIKFIIFYKKFFKKIFYKKLSLKKKHYSKLKFLIFNLKKFKLKKNKKKHLKYIKRKRYLKRLKYSKYKFILNKKTKTLKIVFNKLTLRWKKFFNFKPTYNSKLIFKRKNSLSIIKEFLAKITNLKVNLIFINSLSFSKFFYLFQKINKKKKKERFNILEVQKMMLNKYKYNAIFIKDFIHLAFINILLKNPVPLVKFIGEQFKRLPKNRKQFKLLKFINQSIQIFCKQRPEILGFKVQIYGRLNRRRRTHKWTFQKGILQLQTYMTRVEYGYSEGFTRRGLIGIHLWIFYDNYFNKLLKKKLFQYFFYSKYKSLINHTFLLNKTKQVFIKKNFKWNQKKQQNKKFKNNQNNQQNLTKKKYKFNNTRNKHSNSKNIYSKIFNKKNTNKNSIEKKNNLNHLKKNLHVKT